MTDASAALRQAAARRSVRLAEWREHWPLVIAATVGMSLSGVGAYLSVRFLTRYFSEGRSLNPFGIYCLVAGVASFAYLVLK